MARLLPWAVVAAVLAGVTISVLRLRGAVSLAGPSVAAQVLEVAAGIAVLVVSGVAGGTRQRWLLAPAGAAWLAAEWASPAAPDAAILTVGLIVTLATLPLVLASCPGDTRARARPEATLLGIAVLAAGAAAVLVGPVAAAAASPRDSGCTDCAADLIAVTHNLTLNARLSQLGEQLSIAAGAAAAAWLAVRIVRTRPRLTRPIPTDLAAGAAAGAFAVAVAADAGAIILGGSAAAAGYMWHAGASGMLVVLAATVAWPAVRAARARRAVAAALAQAADPQSQAVDAISGALGDPGLRVAYPTLDGAWRDRDGQPLILPKEHVTVVTDAGQTLAALIHGSPARIDHAGVSGAVSAARLLLDSERLEAGVLARVNDLLLARQLIVAAADAARTSLERDLHDGAQQRLVALRYALGLAAAHAARMSEPAVSQMLADADRAAEEALADLRELAHGISPGAPALGGLAEAVRAVAEQSHWPVSLADFPAEPLTASTEHVAYRFIADSVSHPSRATTAGVFVAVRRRGHEVMIELESDAAVPGADWPPAHAVDRIAAARGHLQRSLTDGRERVVVVLPCE